MKIAVASGKGGTGKTTVAVALAASVGTPVQLLDCDVEAPNARLFLQPAMNPENAEPVTSPVPEIDLEACTLCGKCDEICQYKAVAVVGDTVLVFPELCHGCGGCTAVCPESAVTERGREIGVIRRGKNGSVDFIEGDLNIGEAMAPPLIRAVRKAAAKDIPVIIDAPPGTSCPVVTAVKGVDFVLLVTEPTPFGLNDLTLAVETVKLLKIPLGLVVNRADIGDRRVVEYANAEGLPILMSIPFDRRIAEAYARGGLITEAVPELSTEFQDLFRRIKSKIENTGN
jgi:MinD superfamily P-loop ATPase